MKRKNPEDRTRSKSQKKIKRGNDAVNTGSVDQSKYKRNTLQLNGSKGFLFTCDILKQREALREAYNILDEYVEMMYPSLVDDSSPKSQSSQDKTKLKSMSEMLLAEIKAVKSQRNGGRKVSPRRFFRTVNSGANGLLLIVCVDKKSIINPVHIAEKLCHDILSNRQQKSRYLIRIQPYEIGGSTDEDFLKQSLRLLLERNPTLLTPKDTDEKNGIVVLPNTNQNKFKIVYKRRNHDKSLRGAVGKLAAEINEMHSVDLVKPNVAVLLNVVRGTSFLSILPRYSELREYNLRKLVD
eukprot:g15374.t1